MIEQQIFGDTSLEVERVLVARWRELTPGERLERMSALSRGLFELGLASLRQQFPDESEHTLVVRLAARHLEPKMFQAAFGPPEMTELQS